MPHIEHHAVFKILLVFFQEFDEKAEGEDISQAKPEEEAAVQFLAVILIQVNHDEEQDKISDGFVELPRMAGDCRKYFTVCSIFFHTFENECPGHIRRFADDFGVHQVGKADETGGDWSSYGNHIQHVHIMKFRLTAIQPKGDDQSQCTAVAGKSFISGEFPVSVRHEFDGKNHFPKMRQVISRGIEQAVSQACADQNTKETIKEKRVKLLFFYLFIPVLVVNNHISKEYSYCP